MPRGRLAEKMSGVRHLRPGAVVTSPDPSVEIELVPRPVDRLRRPEGGAVGQTEALPIARSAQPCEVVEGNLNGFLHQGPASSASPGGISEDVPAGIAPGQAWRKGKPSSAQYMTEAF